MRLSAVTGFFVAEIGIRRRIAEALHARIQAASTSTISLSSRAVTLIRSTSLIAAPSRAPTRSPSISTAPTARDEIAEPALPEWILGRLSRLQSGGDDLCVRADRQGVGCSGVAGGEHDELAGAFAPRERPRSPAGFFAGSGRQDPDLENLGRIGLQIIFGMGDPRSRRHHLDVAGNGSPGVAEAVLVADRSLSHIGDYFHVAMRMGRKAGVRGDRVIVPDAQRSPVHASRVVIIGEREMVPGVQPAEIVAAEPSEWPKFDHLFLS